MSRQRRRYSAAYKFKVALVAARGDRTLSQLTQECQLHPEQISTRKQQLLEEEEGGERGAGEGGASGSRLSGRLSCMSRSGGCGWSQSG